MKTGREKTSRSRSFSIDVHLFYLSIYFISNFNLFPCFCVQRTVNYDGYDEL